MTTMGDRDWIQRGEPVVELTTRPAGGRLRVSTLTYISQLTNNLVVTADGARYHRQEMTRLAGPGGMMRGSRLTSAYDPLVIVARAQEHVAALAVIAENLSRLDRTEPADVVGDLANLIRSAQDSRRAVIELMTAASRAEQESPR